MNNWQTQKLSKVCNSIYSGGTPNTRINDYWNGEYYWLSSGETRNPYIYSTEKTITKKGVDNSSTRLANKDIVVMASAVRDILEARHHFYVPIHL
ncbi:MAG: restriction endonuclease subunit S [Candidatus Marinimicrobia bacterium]|nr:restriction endonuclease subunit S [Candidatus Neomarinimicrobiota bacterium]